MQYNLNTGVSHSKSISKKIIVGVVALALPVILLLQGFASATPSQLPPYAFNLVPFEYVGAAGDCGTDSPAGNPDMVTAEWVDTTGNPSPSIKLQKLGLTSNCIAAGVDVITPLENGPVSALTELNFDFKDGWHCGAGAPRFNLELNSTNNAFLGCNSTLGTRTPIGTTGWTHIEFSAADIAAAVITAGGTPTSTLTDLYMIFDEGSDTGPDFTGTAFVDNISVNDGVIGAPSVPRNRADCKNNGWKNFTDENGGTFASEAECLSFVKGQKGNKHGHHHRRGNSDKFNRSMKVWAQHHHSR